MAILDWIELKLVQFNSFGSSIQLVGAHDVSKKVFSQKKIGGNFFVYYGKWSETDF